MTDSNNTNTQSSQELLDEAKAQSPAVFDDDIIDDTPELVAPVQTEGTAVEATASAQESQEVDDAAQANYEEFLIRAQKVFGEFPVFLKLDKFNPDDTTITLPGSFEDYRISKFKHLPKTGLDDSSSASNWLRTVEAGEASLPVGDVYRHALEREDAEWHQAVESQGRKLMGTAPQLSTITGDALTGERAALRFMRFAGLGSVYSIPLWHTGIWITLKAPSEASLLELNRDMFTDKITMGRSTHGLALSGVVSAYSERLLKLAMDHLYTTNLKTDKHLYDVISIHDIPTIIWGIACVVWNNGFQYERACTHDPEKCNHVVQEKLDVTKLLWVNKSALTPWQIAHMSRRKTGEVSIEDVERYKRESLSQQNRRIEMGEGENKYYFELRVPTVREYFEHANDWVDSVVSGVERALQVTPSDQERANYIAESAQSTIMRQYSHWVESISFDENTISDKETIETILNRLSSDDYARERYVEEVKKYINDSAVSVVGIPTYECPKCGGKQKYEQKNETLYSIIPLDMLQTFFFLLVQKIILVHQRFLAKNPKAS